MAQLPDPRTVVLFADVVGSTRLKSQIPYDAALEKIRAHNDHFARAVKDQGGRVVKFIGDGAMARFEHGQQPGALKAVNSAIAFMTRLHKDREEARSKGDEHLIFSRAGIAVAKSGEPTVDIYNDGDPYGISVDIAARVQNLALEDQILITDDVRELIDPSLVECPLRPGPLTETDLFPEPGTKVKLKGVPLHVNVRELKWNDSVLGVPRLPKDIINQLEAQLRLLSAALFAEDPGYRLTLMVPDAAGDFVEPVLRVQDVKTTIMRGRVRFPIGVGFAGRAFAFPGAVHTYGRPFPEFADREAMVAFYSAELGVPAKFVHAMSDFMLRVRNVLCVPIPIVSEKKGADVLGVLSIDTLHEDGFTESRLPRLSKSSIGETFAPISYEIKRVLDEVFSQR